MTAKRLKSKFIEKSRSVPARAENLYSNGHFVSTCCEFFLTLSLKNSVFVLFKLEVCPCLAHKKMYTRERFC